MKCLANPEHLLVLGFNSLTGTQAPRGYLLQPKDRAIRQGKPCQTLQSRADPGPAQPLSLGLSALGWTSQHSPPNRLFLKSSLAILYCSSVAGALGTCSVSPSVRFTLHQSFRLKHSSEGLHPNTATDLWDSEQATEPLWTSFYPSVKC